MGEIFHALDMLNRTMKLGLSNFQLLRAEMSFKSALTRRGDPDPLGAADPIALTEKYELVATLRRRPEQLSLRQLSKLAQQAVMSLKPPIQVDPKTLGQIDNALEKVSSTVTGRKTKRPAAKKSSRARKR